MYKTRKESKNAKRTKKTDYVGGGALLASPQGFWRKLLRPKAPDCRFEDSTNGGNTSLIPPYALKKRAAFTLAEVLITLGIIGIVAALVMPGLIANHRKQAYLAQLKKAANTVTNGLQLILQDTGYEDVADIDIAKMVENGQIKKYFSVIETNKDSDFHYRTYHSFSQPARRDTLGML